MTTQTTKQKTYWAGFTDGKLYFAFDEDPITKERLLDHACLYKSRHAAKRFFDDVRKVRIVEVRS